MTPIGLLERLKEFIEANTGDIILKVRPVKNRTLPSGRGGAGETERAAEVHLMRLPDKDAETQRIPYILLQYLTGRDAQEPKDEPDSVANVRIIVATYSENDGEGALDALNVTTRIRNALLGAGEVGRQFLLRSPLEYLVYPDDTQPYFFAEIMSIWEMPTIKREVNINGEI